MKGIQELSLQCVHSLHRAPIVPTCTRQSYYIHTVASCLQVGDGGIQQGA